MGSIAKKMVGEPGPSIDDLMPDIIRIFEDGSPEERVARLLASMGYTSMDWWRYKKKLPLDAPSTLEIENVLRDLEHGGTAVKKADALRWFLKHKIKGQPSK